MSRTPSVWLSLLSSGILFTLACTSGSGGTDKGGGGSGGASEGGNAGATETGGKGGTNAKGGSGGNKGGSGGSSTTGGSGGTSSTGTGTGGTAVGGSGGTANTGAGGSGGTAVAGDPTKPRQEPVVSLPMDDGTGVLVADTSGLKHMCVLLSADVATVWQNGKTGKGVVFDGVDYLLVRHSPYLDNLHIVGEVSLAAWVYPTAFDTLNKKPQFIIGRQLGDTFHNQFGLALVNEGKPGAFFGEGASLSSATALPLNKWSHVAVTYDGLTAILYVNGKQDSMLVVGAELVAEDNDVFIGGDKNSAFGVGEFFLGTMDEVRLYNRALKVDEITTLAK
jgi:Concanavalin A-like lectin/glucanases superfamily